MLNRLFKGKSKARKTRKSPPLSDDEVKRLARAEDPGVRSEIAGREDVRPEVLYYLAEDEAPGVRRRIAANPETPRQADVILARDVDDEVRCDLALKIGRLIPGLSSEEYSRLQDLTFEVLNILASDQLPRVRQIIAEEIKHAGNVPHDIVNELARDVEHIVAAPILEYSILLTDQDLMEIIAAGPIEGALPAIARRASVSGRVSDALASSEDVPAIASLLANPNAQIREETLDSILDRAPAVPPWHEPLTVRPNLSQRALRRIAGFVTSSLLSILAERNDLDPETTREVAEAVKERLKEPLPGDEGESIEERARRMFTAGQIDDEALTNAAEQGQREFAVHALALKAAMAVPLVRKILDSKAGKAVTALTWKADPCLSG